MNNAVKETLHTLLTEFNYNSIGPDGIVTVGFYKDLDNNEESHLFGLINGTEDSFHDACLYRPGHRQVPYVDEASLLVSRSGRLQTIHHIFYFFDFEKKRKIIAYDIQNNPEVSHYYKTHNKGMFPILTFKCL